MQLIVLTPEHTQENETEVVSNLFALGLQRLHLRKPLFKEPDYKAYLAAIDKQYHSSVVIHNNFQLYEELALGGIHLNSASRNDSAVPDQVKHLPPSVISTSFHSWQEIEKNRFGYGYVFISPVFDSITKEGYKAGIDLAGAEEARGVLAIQGKYCPAIIALGGVDAKHIKKLHQHGFDGAALLGAIWKDEDPVEKFESIMEIASNLQGD
jgi:thiamine-phosphate pyrophosphorylase